MEQAKRNPKPKNKVQLTPPSSSRKKAISADSIFLPLFLIAARDRA